MKSFLAAALLVLAGATSGHAAPVYTTTTYVTYDPAAPTGNFGAPTNFDNVTDYKVLSGQDSQNIYVDIVATGTQAGNALPFANIYFGGNTSVGIEVTNNRAFIPGGNGTYYDLTGTGFTFTNNPGDISFVLPFSFLTIDPLGMGFNKLSSAPGNNFTRISLSQTFSYSVAGGQAFYGTNRLGAFTVPGSASAVPEPASMALLGTGMVGLLMARRRRQ